MKNVFIALCCFLLVSCSQQSKKDSPFDEFLKNVSQRDLFNESKMIIIIPNAGCSGCIMASEKFMFENIDKLDSTYFILTAFNSVKELKVKYSETDPKLLKKEKVILDVNKEFEKINLDKRYPIVLFIKNSAVESFEHLDVENQTLLARIKSI